MKAIFSEIFKHNIQAKKKFKKSLKWKHFLRILSIIIFNEKIIFSSVYIQSITVVKLWNERENV